MFSSIHYNYLFTCISEIDHITYIIMGRLQGGVAILYHKYLTGISNHFTITNRRLCGININVNSLLVYQFTCLVIITQELLLIRRFLIVLMILNVF